jgi:mannose-1-phosphate guanylyltransferase
MKAVILAGGEGTRLRPLTLTRPKPLMPVAGKPCIEYVIRALLKAGLKDLIVTAGYKAQMLKDTLDDASGFGANIDFSFEQTPMGTAGAVKKVAQKLDGTFVVASGDVLADVNFKALVDFHKKKKAMATMALTKVDDPCQFGIVGLDKQGRIVKFKEKPRPEDVFSNLINAGIYVLEPEVLDLVPKDTMFDFSKNTFPQVLEKHPGKLVGRPLSGLWMDIGKPSDLLEANFRVIKRDGKKRTVNGRKYTTPSLVSELSLLSKATKVKGPCYFAPGSKIGGKAVLDTVAIYEKAIVEEAKLTRCIVLEGATVSPGAVLENTIVGRGTVVGPGKILKDQFLADEKSV